MEHTADKKKRLLLWLCYGLLLLLVFTGSSIAGYKTIASGSDSARVAAFRCDATFTGTSCPRDNDTITLTAGEQEGVAYSFKVTNDSEVTVRYTLMVSKANSTDPWLDGTGLKLQTGTSINLNDLTWDSARHAYCYTYPTTLTPVGGSTCTKNESLFIDPETASPVELGEIVISVLFEQVD